MIEALKKKCVNGCWRNSDLIPPSYLERKSFSFANKSSKELNIAWFNVKSVASRRKPINKHLKPRINYLKMWQVTSGN